jgi:hypothetical protein
MRLSTQIKQIEAELEAMGLPSHNIVTVICKRARINRTTYERWRNGHTKPLHENWERVATHVQRIKEDISNGKPVVVRRRRRKAQKPRR